MQAGSRLVAALAGAAVVMCAPAAAQGAVTAAVTGDNGVPTQLVAGAPLPITNMDVRGYVHVDEADAVSYQWQVVDATGTGATSLSPCWNTSVAIARDDNRLVTYRGNGTYTLALNLYAAKNCAGAATPKTFQWTTSSAVSLSAPGTPQLIRDPNTATTKTQLLGFSGPPGAISYEIKYAKDATVAADGSLGGLNIQDAYLDRATGQVQIIGARDPGTYTAVARAKIGDFATPWSAPVQLQLQQPFDILTGSFTDRRGPSYKMRTTMRDAWLRGSRVTVAIAKGKTGKRFRTVGKPKVNSKGQFSVRFSVRKLGWYRVRYSFKGNGTVARGTSYAQVRFRRVIF
jgi:hypothetical protein